MSLALVGLENDDHGRGGIVVSPEVTDGLDGIIRMRRFLNIVSLVLVMIRTYTQDDTSRDGLLTGENLFLKYNATFTRPMSTGTSTSGPITVANAWPE